MTTQHQQDTTDDKASAGTFASTQNTPDTETPASRLDRARHIAGHATLALAQGIDVELLTIENPTSVIVDRDGARFIDEGTMRRLDMPQFTYKKGQYLAFIHLYRKLHRQGPAEADMVK